MNEPLKALLKGIDSVPVSLIKEADGAQADVKGVFEVGATEYDGERVTQRAINPQITVSTADAADYSEGDTALINAVYYKIRDAITDRVQTTFLLSRGLLWTLYLEAGDAILLESAQAILHEGSSKV